MGYAASDANEKTELVEVQIVTVLEALKSGHPDFDSAVVNVVYRWSFMPAKDRKGKPAVSTVSRPVVIDLR